ncbi:MAG TPA: hypothetical protein VF937_11475, partial [Chloroflexota bacterium]
VLSIWRTAMFRFLMGVAFGAACYWAWQSFGRDLLGLGGDQDSYAGYTANTTFNSGTPNSNSFGGSASQSNPSTTTAPTASSDASAT